MQYPIFRKTLSAPLLFVAFLSLFHFGCSEPGQQQKETLINTAHLQHLFEEIEMDTVKAGAIWIYSEAPDYHLVTDDDEGFTCVDDVARALVFYSRHHAVDPSPEVVGKIRSLTRFVLNMQAENGYFYNFLLPGPQINNTHKNSLPIANWWSWRAFWALSEVTRLNEPELASLQSASRASMETLLLHMKGICSAVGEKEYFDGIATPHCLVDLGTDQVAVMMIGLVNYYQEKPDTSVRSLLINLGNQLLEMQYGTGEQFPFGAFLSWRNYWHAWGNSQAYALLKTGGVLNHRPFIDAGLQEVTYFYPYCEKSGWLSGFKLSKEADGDFTTEIDTFPQIAYGFRPMIFAALEAYKLTGEPRYAKMANLIGTWFFGNNPAGRQMYDPETGRTFDGIISSEQINRNSGAESTIEGLLSIQALEAVPKALNENENENEN